MDKIIEVFNSRAIYGGILILEVIDKWDTKYDCTSFTDHYVAVNRNGDLYVVYKIGENEISNTVARWRICDYSPV